MPRLAWADDVRRLVLSVGTLVCGFARQVCRTASGSGPPVQTTSAEEFAAGPRFTLEQLELATARWVDWYNQRSLLTSIGNLPSVQYEAAYNAERYGSAVA